MAYIYTNSITDTTFQAFVGGLDTSYSRDDRYVYWYRNDTKSSFEPDISAYASSGGGIRFTDLTPGTEYRIHARIYYTDSGVYKSTRVPSSGYEYVTTTGQASNPTIDSFTASVSGTTVTCEWETSDITGSYSYRLYARLLGETAYTLKQSGTSYYADDYDYITLTAGQKYNIKLEITYQGTTYSKTTAVTVAATRPGTFSWTNAKVKNQPFNITAEEWNRLQTNINAVRQYKGYGDYSFTSAVRGAVFRASHYNQIVYAIRECGGTGMGTATAGNTIYAADINTLRDKINGIT